MRKLFMLAAMALAALAVMAPSASAQYASDPNPDFPLDDFDPANWVAVDAYGSGGDCADEPCAFEGVPQFTWDQLVFSYPHVDHCDVELEGAVTADGGIEITGVSEWTGGQQTGDSPYCTENQPVDLPWTGQMCINRGTEQAFVRLDATVDSSFGQGDIFGEVKDYGTFNSPHLSFDGSIFNHQLSNWVYQSSMTTRWSFDAALGSVSVVAPDGDEAPCSWPELQA